MSLEVLGLASETAICAMREWSHPYAVVIELALHSFQHNEVWHYGLKSS